MYYEYPHNTNIIFYRYLRFVSHMTLQTIRLTRLFSKNVLPTLWKERYRRKISRFLIFIPGLCQKP